MYRRATFYPGGVYHVYNRGVAKQTLFHDVQDYQHFFETLNFYLEASPGLRFSRTSHEQRADMLKRLPNQPLIDILAYCFMPNHFHLIVTERVDWGVSTFMRRALNSYTRAYNTRYKRVGTIFQGTFSAVDVRSDEQLLHLSRYVHLNPYVARLVETPAAYSWFSYPLFLKGMSARFCVTQKILDLIGSPVLYKDFVEDYAGYARDAALLKKIGIDIVASD